MELQHASPSYAYWYNNKRWHSSLGYLLLLNLKNTYPFNFLFENVLPFQLLLIIKKENE
ncbi:hypothetical protein [Gilliamella sp. WF3-4]|uniref:hypothetical protein n=1 Tax=Gilliamella sp. WF3-4 TaxID=3120255 RepID=UPI003FA5DD34